MQVLDWLRATWKIVFFSELKEIRNFCQWLKSFQKFACHYLITGRLLYSEGSENISIEIRPVYSCHFSMTSNPSFLKLLKLLILIASLLCWQQISLWITYSNQEELMIWNWSLVEDSWGKTSAVTFQAEGSTVIWEHSSWTDGLRMLLLDLNPQAICSTHKNVSWSPFPSDSVAWLSLNKHWSSHWCSLSLFKNCPKGYSTENAHRSCTWTLTHLPYLSYLPITNIGVAYTQKTNGDIASSLQRQKMGKECTHAIECISFFTGVVDNTIF